jgi:ubiquinone/menaquinone biosynthesis C-methylase UbiE
MGIMERLDKREEYYKVAFARLRRAIESGVLGEDSEEIRTWIEQHCVGYGLDICTGDFTIGENSIGIDGDVLKLGCHYNIQGDQLTPVNNSEMDYVVTNYFDCFPNPLSTLQEWSRVLRSGGALAFACCNNDSYTATDPMGPLANQHRLSCFTASTIRVYLHRAGFTAVEVTEHKKHLFVKAIKT